MSRGTSRRDFVKTGLAASLAAASRRSEEAVVTGVTSASRADNGEPASPDVSHHLSFPRVHTGRQLARISYPLGGIGTGSIGLGGRGNLQDWQIFNRSDIGNSLDYAFPGLWVKLPEETPFASVLERRILPPYDLHQEGLGFANVPGLPRMAEAKFFGSFPTARIAFEEPRCPVKVALEAFSPFQPLDADASGLPCAVLTYEVHNPNAVAAEVVIAWSVTNPVGEGVTRRNVQRTAAKLSGLIMTDPALDAKDAMWGSFVLAALPGNGARVEMLEGWRGGTIWRAGPQRFWFDHFVQTGGLGKALEPFSPTGSVSLRKNIPAGDTVSFRFLLAWHFPNRTAERCGWETAKGQQDALLGNYYCIRFKDAWEVAEHVADNVTVLEKNTRAFVAALQRSTLPDAVKEAASSNLSTLASNTCFRSADGSFQGFEGCGDEGGLGFGTCTHVWNYEVATQFVFPAMARSMRETSFGYATDAEGHMDFRHLLPLGNQRWGAAAADGQMGQIAKLYLDWTLLGDDDWLRKQWPAAKRALCYAWRPGGWDERKTGVMDGVQHNTYDVEFYGPNPMCSSWYLAALRATARMADAMGEADFARECAAMADRGSRWIDANLFNGEYYVQKVRGIPADKIASGLRVGMGTTDTMHPTFQVGDGCLIDQLVGQYMATIAGLGNLLGAEHIRTTMASIYRYNYKRNLMEHASVERVYALNDEAALVICDYKKGTRPEIPFPYYSENFTGLEYVAATLMMAYGMVDEGVECIGNIRRRYDGEKANPFDETEYGRHYARAMASWAAIPVLSGFRYDGRTQRMEIAPLVSGQTVRSFWSTPTAWGEFALTAKGLTVTPVAGKIQVRELRFACRPHGKLTTLSGSDEIESHVSRVGEGIVLTFPSAFEMVEERPLSVTW